jgi:hypothetical protein
MNDIQSLQADIASRLLISHLPPEEQTKIVEALTDLVIDKIQLEIWKRLDIEQRKAFAALREQGEVSLFMEKNVPELQSIIELCARVTLQEHEPD